MKNYSLVVALLAFAFSTQAQTAPSESAEYDVAVDVSVNDKTLVECKSVLTAGDVPCEYQEQEAYIKSIKGNVITPGVENRSVKGVVTLSHSGGENVGTATVKFTNMIDPTYVVKSRSKGKTVTTPGVFDEEINFSFAQGATSKSVGAYKVTVKVTPTNAGGNITL